MLGLADDLGGVAVLEIWLPDSFDAESRVLKVCLLSSYYE